MIGTSTGSSERSCNSQSHTVTLLAHPRADPPWFHRVQFQSDVHPACTPSDSKHSDIASEHTDPAPFAFGFRAPVYRPHEYIASHLVLLSLGRAWREDDRSLPEQTPMHSWRRSSRWS
jgi:hypothetical protein